MAGYDIFSRAISFSEPEQKKNSLAGNKTKLVPRARLSGHGSRASLEW